jgi:hypothetical protein
LLYHNDRAAFFNTLATVFIEDIGYGCANGLAVSMALTGKSFRDQIPNDLATASGMIVEATQGGKTRSCCELTFGVDLENAPLLEEMQTWSTDILIQNLGLDIYNDYRILLTLRGRAYSLAKEKRRGKDPEGLARAYQYYQERLPWWHYVAGVTSTQKAFDNMCIGYLPLADWIGRDEAAGTIRTESDVIPTTFINGVDAACMDMHTRVGSNAIRACWNQLNPRNNWMRTFDGSQAKKNVGMALFVVEGSNEQSRIRSVLLDELKTFQDHNLITRYGNLNPMFVQDAQNTVLNNLPYLNELRKWASNKEL